MLRKILKMSKLRILNLGCGTRPLKDTDSREYVNIDIIPPPPDCDATYIERNILTIPWPDLGRFDRVLFFHCIEHIPEELHHKLLIGIRSQLKKDGELAIVYPEFTKCATNYIKNYKGMREFWKDTIYGRGLTEWDRHKTLMDTNFFKFVLRDCGLPSYKIYPERNDPWYTVVLCKVGPIAPSYEDLLGKEYAST
jgi:SAM-dependent methyltransferase